MTQTAVEWLIEQLIPKDQHEGIMDIIEEAKQMEKEQTLEFTRNAVRKILDEDRQNPFNLEQYYNETIGLHNT
jgi:hypothetical protein